MFDGKDDEVVGAVPVSKVHRFVMLDVGVGTPPYRIGSSVRASEIGTVGNSPYQQLMGAGSEWMLFGDFDPTEHLSRATPTSAAARTASASATSG